MGKVKFLIICIICSHLISFENVNAEDFSVFQSSVLGGNSYNIFGKVDDGYSTVVCRGPNVVKLTAVACLSKIQCDERLTCLRHPYFPNCLNHVSSGQRDSCPSPFHSNPYSKNLCVALKWLNWSNSLNHRLLVDRYLCTTNDGQELLYDHFPGQLHYKNGIAADSTFDGDLELQIFNGSSAIRVQTRQTQSPVVHLFSSEAIFVRCRISRSVFSKPRISPIKARYRNGSFIDIDPDPDVVEKPEYWEFAYTEFIVSKEMTSLSCYALNSGVEKRIIDFNVKDPEFPPTIRNDGVKVKVELDHKLDCRLLNLFPAQKEIFFYTVQEHGVKFDKKTNVTSFLGYSRLFQLAQEMNVTIHCQKNTIAMNSAADFFFLLENPTPLQLKNPVMIDKRTTVIDRYSIDPIRCEFIGLPPFSVVWLLNNNQSLQFSWGQRDSNKSTGNLPPGYSHHYSTLNLPQLSGHSGLSSVDSYPTFSCLVSNSLGTDRHDFMTATAAKIKRNSTVPNSKDEPKFDHVDTYDDGGDEPNTEESSPLLFVTCFLLILTVLLVIQCCRIKMLQPSARADKVRENIEVEEQLNELSPSLVPLASGVYPVVDWGV